MDGPRRARELRGLRPRGDLPVPTQHVRPPCRLAARDVRGTTKELRLRHPSLFAMRDQNRRRSSAPVALKIAITAVDGMPWLTRLHADPAERALHPTAVERRDPQYGKDGLPGDRDPQRTTLTLASKPERSVRVVVVSYCHPPFPGAGGNRWDAMSHYLPGARVRGHDHRLRCAGRAADRLGAGCRGA